MSKTDLKNLIAAKIAGQGNQVDLGGALDTILNEIVDLIPAPYSLPAASAETLGGVKVGDGLGIDENGVLSSQGGGDANIIHITAEYVPQEQSSTELHFYSAQSRQQVIDAIKQGAVCTCTFHVPGVLIGEEQDIYVTSYVFVGSVGTEPKLSWTDYYAGEGLFMNENSYVCTWHVI